MATNRDLLKEAIADAKAVKETAIANAKAALEEAFTPQLKSMFAAKLQEMELEEEENEREGFGDFDTEDNAGFGMMDAKALDEEDLSEYSEEHEDPKTKARVTAKDVTETDLDEYRELQPTDLPKGMSGIKKDEKVDEVDLEELLRELELEEEDMGENLYEAEENDEDDTDVSDEDSDEGDEEGTPLDLEDMTDEDLKDIIEDVIKEMIKSGELEAGEEGEEEGEEEEEEVDLAELLKEIEEMEDKEMYEEKEEMNEALGLQLWDLLSNDGLVSAMSGIPVFAAPFAVAAGIVANAYRKYKKDEKLKSMKDTDVAKIAAKDASFKSSEEGQAAEDKAEVTKSVAETELQEAHKTIDTLKSELNEINLLNAKLLYTNKIFKSKNLNESQKVKVLSSFDKATTVGEVKLVFETLNEGIKVKSNVIKENLGSASKSTVTPNVNKPIVESNDAFTRMQKLAGII